MAEAGKLINLIERYCDPLFARPISAKTNQLIRTRLTLIRRAVENIYGSVPDSDISIQDAAAELFAMADAKFHKVVTVPAPPKTKQEKTPPRKDPTELLKLDDPDEKVKPIKQRRTRILHKLGLKKSGGQKRTRHKWKYAEWQLEEMKKWTPAPRKRITLDACLAEITKGEV